MNLAYNTKSVPSFTREITRELIKTRVFNLNNELIKMLELQTCVAIHLCEVGELNVARTVLSSVKHMKTY